MWGGYIKDYDGGTLMDCAMNPLVRYADIARIVRLQRAAVDGRVRELSHAHIVYPVSACKKKHFSASFWAA